jgi:hypothetical protein
MQISNSKFLKVWKVTVEDGRKKVNLGDSKKNQDGTYTNWTWFFCNLLGNAKGIQVNEGDTITIKSGKLDKLFLDRVDLIMTNHNKKPTSNIINTGKTNTKIPIIQ